jgi:AraC family transcriptional regulator of adaptative response/methylated-DNA-[protein]-cysteine methyltransferase
MQPSNSTTALEDDIRWEAMTTGRVDGVDRFVIAVTSTGIYCRIGCPARRPLRKNVIFFETVEGARAAGFRACKKCHPGDHL